MVRDHEPSTGRGRPKVRYRLAEAWPGTETVPGDLAELLAGLIQRLDPSDREVEEFGRQWGAFLAGRPGARAQAAGPARALERLGFDVEEGPELRLRACPCPLVSPAEPELVCHLARSVANGALKVSTEGAGVARAEHHPERRTCTLWIRRPGR